MSAHVTTRNAPQGLAPQQYLSFTLRQELYAMPIAQVKEIIEYGHITTIPLTPDYMRGVINLRGAVVPVIDLSCRFGQGVSAITKRSCIVIMDLPIETSQEAERQVLGVIVDAVNAVREIAPEDIEPPPRFGTHIRSDFVMGVGRNQGRLMMILDVFRVLSLEELRELQSASQHSDVALT